MSTQFISSSPNQTTEPSLESMDSISSRPTLSPAPSYSKPPTSSEQLPYEIPYEIPYEKPVDQHNPYEDTNTHHNENGYTDQEPVYGENAPISDSKTTTYGTGHYDEKSHYPNGYPNGYPSAYPSAYPNAYPSGYPSGGKIIDVIDFPKISTESSHEDITKITTGLLELLSHGEINHCGGTTSTAESFFLEGILRKFQLEVLDRWKREFLFPSISVWIEKHLLKFFRISHEKLIREYEARILVIRGNHEKEMRQREERNKKIYHDVIVQAWAAYERNMRDIEFVKEVRFKYVPKDERERWGEFIRDIAPELQKYVPRRYEPNWSFDDCRHVKYGAVGGTRVHDESVVD